jgi:DNA-binding NtrC family response regulator
MYQQHASDISLVILDLLMPEMGGKQCLEKLLEIDPKLKVIIATGYSTDQIKETASGNGAKGYLRKPFQLAQMLNTVREVLDRD